MENAVELLRRKADDYAALGEEHHAVDDPQRVAYDVLKIVLRELANALEEAGGDD